ncbi:ATP-NAD kinase [Basidiobolus meristosporus CBS 931.73]|uniref:ATP-NAD kinase n=1 Tax=Basidiobolus meristosporus CBS 931.73 TaxID=1314790 RepID=A0A1Y1YDM7_9FUNG|nr:ATP-NAD kinase [Basidiobolus meristosporus CBS 931.73]|eukprot:ORX96045.1 ATP-NAD kinase [Basidiobolus meristosporus CBS 931.73]
MSELKSYLVELEIVTNIVIVTKPTPELVKHTKLVATWLLNKYKNLTVYVGDTFKENPAFKQEALASENPAIVNRLKFWSRQNLPDYVDLAVTLGGDGTVLYTSLLFQGKVPPILSFHLGSLGFLTVFNFGQFQDTLSYIIDSKSVQVNLRMRIKCTLYQRMVNRLMESENTPLYGSGLGMSDLSLDDLDEDSCALTKSGVYHVVNELVVDRGANPNMVMLELFVDNIHLTTVLADGLVIATATGSTAYSLSAGGSLIHPEMYAILVTQICPHTLTCRPMVIPGYKELRICVPSQARSTAWASFDGHHRVELNRGDSITITASNFPLPSICKDDQSKDWFNGLRRVLNWNERIPQKMFHPSSWDFE